MDISLTPELKKSLATIKLRDPKLLQKVNKQLKIFQGDMHHPSLATHKLKGNLSDSYSISIERNIRMLFRVSNNKRVVFYLIGTHDQVYRNEK